MTAAELMKEAQKESPEFVEKTAKALSALELIDSEQGTDFSKELAADVKEILDHTAGKAKTAAMDLRNFGLAAGGALLAGVGAAVATDLYDAAKRGLTKGVNYRRIMQSNPDLRESDPKRLRAAYDALHRFAPDFTADPLVGGSMLKNITDAPSGMEGKLISELINARKNLTEAKGKGFRLDNTLGAALIAKTRTEEKKGPRSHPL